MARKKLIQLVGSLQHLVKTRLWAQIFAGMFMGIAVGLLLSPSGAALVDTETAYAVSGWLALPGYVFLALVKMVVIPLILSSIILGLTSSGDPAYLKRIAMRVFPYFALMTTTAVVIGISTATLIKPGNYVDKDLITRTVDVENAVPAATVPAADSETLPEKIVSLIPTNPLGAALEGQMLQVVIFAILMGIALVATSENRAKPLLDMLDSLREVSMKVVGWAMMLAPYAVFGLLSQVTIKVGFDAILGMSVYVGTVLLGLFLVLCWYLLVARVFAKQKPLAFLRKIREVQLLAFSTSSSAAVMPLSIKTAEEKLNIRPSIAQFIVPLGATVNMDGTACYQVIAAVFLTQVFGIELSLGSLILLTITTVGASIGTPSAPGVGIVILATILQTIGVPPSGIALIIGVDRILDMARTSVNVTGDLTACAVMNRWIKK
jgi:proton glutamate symport protein